VLCPAHGEQNRTFGVVGVVPASTVGAVVVNNTRRRHHDAATTLLYALHVPDMAPRHPALQPADVIGRRRQWLSALGQNRQRKVVVGAARRIALGDVRRALARVIEHR